jgi:OFA family oxalate/formate antiporter-like MFS transporter
MNRWLPVVGGVALNLALGSLYAWSVFVLPLEQEFGWSRADTSWVFTIAVVTTTAGFLFGGRLQDKKGPRICAAIAAVMVGIGFFLSSWTSSLGYLYLVFGVVVGAGGGIGYAAPIPVASKWFPDKRGLVVGIMVAGYGGGSAIVGLVAPVLIRSIGWRTTLQILGVLFLIMGLIGTWLLRNPPAGYRPAGWTPSSPTPARSGADYSPAEMLRTPTFYTLWIAYCFGATAGLMVISQLGPFASASGLSVAVAINVAAGGNAAGRIFSGWLSDALGRLMTLRVMVLVSAIAVPIFFAVRTQVVVFYLLTFVIYWCYGTLLSVFASTTADFYGTKNLGVNYGLLFTSWGAAGVLGPMIAGKVYDAFGSYQYAFYTAGALALVSLASLLMARPPQESLRTGAVTASVTANR